MFVIDQQRFLMGDTIREHGLVINDSTLLNPQGLVTKTYVDSFARPRPIEKLWHRGLAATYTGQFTEYILSQPSGDPVGSWTKTVTQDGFGANTGVAYRLRFACPATATGVQGGNTRMWHLYDALTAIDSEIRSQWGPGSGAGPGQVEQYGHVHRAGIHPTTGRPWGYIAWQDVVFGQSHLINIGVWTTDGTNVTLTAYAGVELRGLLPSARNPTNYIWASRSSITSQVQTVLAFGHRFVIGDRVTLSTSGAAHNFTNLTVTDVTADSFNVARPGAADISLATVFGSATKVSQLFPYNVVTRIDGTGTDTFVMVKAWGTDVAEPNWGDGRHVYTWRDINDEGPNVAGKCGLYAGHLRPTNWVEFGSVTFISQD